MKFPADSSCKKNLLLCDKYEYDELTLFEVFRLKIHLIICKPCRTYSEKNHQLTDAVKTAKIQTLGEDEKISLKNRLKKEMNNS